MHPSSPQFQTTVDKKLSVIILVLSTAALFLVRNNTCTILIMMLMMKILLFMALYNFRYSKDAYEVFMGSLYPIALTTLKGFSDHLLRWYSDEGNNEKTVFKIQGSAESEISHLQAQNKPTDKYLPGDTEILDDCDSNFAGTSNKELIANGQHQYSANSENYFNHSDSNQKNITYDNRIKLDTSLSSEGGSSFRGNVIDNKPQTSGVTDDVEHVEQLSNSSISEIGTGVFTMFELNPSARKLLPNLVVGMKYMRHNSKAPELFINEDDSFVSVTK